VIVIKESYNNQGTLETSFRSSIWLLYNNIQYVSIASKIDFSLLYLTKLVIDCR